MKKYFLFISTILAGFISKNSFSQNSFSAPGKTVAIYSQKRFLNNYPLDSLISRINILNPNKNVRYVKSDEDKSTKELTTDYFVKLDVDITIPLTKKPDYKVVEVITPGSESVKQPDGKSKVVEKNITTQQLVSTGTYTDPCEGLIKISITEKGNKNPKTINTISAKADNEASLNNKLIIAIMQYLILNYSD